MQGKLSRGEFVRLVHRLGRRTATGALVVMESPHRRHRAHLRRGYLTHVELDGASPIRPYDDQVERVLLRRTEHALERLTSIFEGTYTFDPHARPPLGMACPVSLCAWARKHLEARVDAACARAMAAELAGARLALCKDLVPDPALLDDTDHRIVAALAAPRRLDEIEQVARAPRLRLLSFVHYLRAVGALELAGVVAAQIPPNSARTRRDMTL